MNISQNIRVYRKKAGLSQKELGEKLGVSQQHIAQYENGKRTPKLETIIKIASALDCEISDIDENIVITHHILHSPKLTPEDIEQYKRDAEARELIEKRASEEDITEEEHQKIADYIERIRNSFALLPERTKELKNKIDKIGENILLADYRELNTDGQSEARKRVHELTEIPRYTKPPEPPQE